MIRDYHNSSCGRVTIMLLLTIGLLSFFTSSALAVPCVGVCDSPLTEIDHRWNPDVDPEPGAPVPDFCVCPWIGCDSVVAEFVDWSDGYIDTWEWDFGDPSSGSANYSNEEYPVHVYRTPGIYTVTLTVIGPGGTESITKTDLITVLEDAIADFVVVSQSGCAPTTVQFEDRSYRPNAWSWDFGDPASGPDNTSDLQNPSHTYASPGTYTVRLTVSNECGYAKTVKEALISVGEDPHADFTSDKTEYCTESVVQFTDLSTGAITRHWDFGDGDTSNAQHPTHIYTSPGRYTVTLTVANGCGDDTEQKFEYITVSPLPVAGFTSSNPEICTGTTVDFTDQSQHADSLLWDFGDGSTSTATNPSHTYAQSGRYTVTLTAFNGCGNDQDVRSAFVYVVDEPVAEFTVDNQDPCVNETIQFTDQSRDAWSWSWDFGDGLGSPDVNPTHQYSSPGTYTVTLTVSNICGDDDEVKLAYIEVSPLPVADFDVDKTSGCAELTVQFTDQSNFADGWHWWFGDGEEGSGPTPQHTYDTAGVYWVMLEVWNECGTDTAWIPEPIVVGKAPVADFMTYTPETCVGWAVDFDDLSTDADSWEWTFGDGTNPVTVQNPSHTYNAPGLYTVELTVENDCGDDTETKINYILVHPFPVADFSADPVEGCVPLTVNFTDHSEYAERWDWDFGDGDTSDDPSPSHTFYDPGTHRVTLTVENGCGSSDTTLLITVLEGPFPWFTVDRRTACVDDTLHFTNQSTDADSYHWDFGDGTTSDEEHPSHTYDATGEYDVSLVATNRCGSREEYRTYYITITEGPEADFRASRTEGCVGIEIDFENLSQNATSYRWDFGDGTSGSTGYEPSHVYNTAGVFTVSLTATNDCGDDTETKIEYITIYPPPIAEFTADTTDICFGDTVQFTDLSTHALSWEWDFGDGDFSFDQHPTHVYDNAMGVFTVSLRVDNDCGYDYEYKEQYIRVSMPPTAGFHADDIRYCAGETVNFWDDSYYADMYHWDFGDGQTSDATNPTHVYNTAGTYTVTQIVENPCGTDTMTIEEYVVVEAGPVADFMSSATDICIGAAVSFTDRSTNAETWDWNFGDGGTDNIENPTHTYRTAGVYTVTLRVTNDCGDDTETKTHYVRVLGSPIADFNTEVPEGCVGEEILFFDQSMYAVTWSWDFGDPASGSDNYSDVPNPTHSYSAPGKYTITLTVTNPCGDDTETKVDYITIHEGPTADFSGTPLYGHAPLTVSFTDLSISTLPINSWDWDFGDSLTSDVQNPTHIYTDPGLYTVTLIVENDCGLDHATKVAYVEVVSSCEVDFTAEPLSGCAPLEVFFHGEPFGTCEISAWTWDFGDPSSGNDNTGSGQDVTHIYTSTGVYSVTLTATDVSGDIVVTKTDLITVYGPPVAGFDASPSSGIAPLMVYFTDLTTSDIPISSWSWDFGDPNSGSANYASVPDPSHFYADDGVYAVTLIVGNGCGYDTVTSDINVTPAISLIKAVDKPFAPFGDELLYTVTIRNNSPEPIGPVSVVDTIPDSTSYLIGTVTGGGSYTSRGGFLTWTLSSIGPGAEVDLTFRVMIDGPFDQFPGIVSNVAYASLPQIAAADPYAWVSNRVETIVDMPTGDLDVSKDVDIVLASPGDMLTYTVTVDNSNPITAFNVIIRDAVPDLTTYVANSASPGGVYYPQNDSLAWNLGAMGPFGSRTVSFQVTVNNGVPDGTQIPNTAVATSSIGGNESNEVITAVSLTPIVITKSVSRPSGMLGDLIQFTIKVENFSGALFTGLEVIDTMPGGIFYVEGTSLLDGASVADPTGDNPHLWALGDLPANGSVTLEYTTLVGATAAMGLHDNIARAMAWQGGVPVNSNRALAQIYILGQTLTGSIRGKVIVDCDGDGVADMDAVPTGMDVYLDDGSQSRVNNKGMFYFSTVRAGEHVVALDERDLEAFYIPEDAQASVFVHVHETGESYVIFRVCPEYPRLDMIKEASIVPTVKITKTASLNADKLAEQKGVIVDYEIDVASNGLADPTQVRIVDSIPESTSLLLEDNQILTPIQNGKQLTYEVTAAQERLQKKVQYSLVDMTPGLRKFLSNKVHLESDVKVAGEETTMKVSDPVEVTAGPFLLVPPQDVNITLTPALFITSKADLQPPAVPLLEAVADSIDKYADSPVKVEGHTDYRIINTVEFPSNWELGEGRAKAVVDWLVEHGIDGDRMTYESFAATRPIVTVGTTSEELQPNRRTEVIIRAEMGGFVAPSVLPNARWEKSTSLTLEPVKYDTLFESSGAPVDLAIDDSWEVMLTVENTSAIGAENAALSDVLPDGVEYIANSATVDGRSLNATVDGKTLKMVLDKIDPGQKLTLRYRVRALPGQTPSGGGAASIEVKATNNLPVVQKSNDVRFQ